MSNLIYYLQGFPTNVGSGQMSSKETTYAAARTATVSDGGGYQTDINGSLVVQRLNGGFYSVMRLYVYFANPLNIKKPDAATLYLKCWNYSGATREFYIVANNTTLDGTLNGNDFGNSSYTLYSSVFTAPDNADTLFEVPLNEVGRNNINGGAFSFNVITKEEYDNTAPTTNTNSCYLVLGHIYGSYLKCKYNKTSKINSKLLSAVNKVEPKTTSQFIKINGVLGKDSVSPTAPTSFATTGQTDTTVGLQWNPSYDLFGVYRYRVTWDGGASYQDVIGLSTTITGLSPATAYEFYVYAYDDANNFSSPSNVVNTNTTLFAITWLYTNDYPTTGAGQIIVNSSTVVYTTTNNDSGIIYVYNNDFVEIWADGGDSANADIEVDYVLVAQISSPTDAYYSLNASANYNVLMAGVQ